jgi:hypothetical protein
MKNFSVLHILLFLLLMLAYQCAKAQDYVVTLKGDTIYGRIKVHAYGPEKKVQVATVDGEKNAYSILQIRSFNLKGEKYAPVRAASGYVFMKLIKEGYLSFYAFQLPNQVTYDGQYLLKKDGHGIEVPNLAFKKIITRYLEDCEAVTSKIESGELGRNSIEKIVDAYNLCITGKTNNQPQAVVQKTQQSKKLDAWAALEEKVKDNPDFEGKSDALEMITEIKSKIEKEEKIPNFLVEGLKSNLSNTALSEDLDNALKELGN